MAVTEQQVIELYIATFNRAPDAAGLDYWVNSGLTIEEIAQSFFDQPETQSLYPDGTTDEAFVTSIYSNVFGRTPDAAGLQYWVDELANGMDRSVMILAMTNGALGDDAKLLENKTAVAEDFVAKGINDVDLAKAALAPVTADPATVAEGIAVYSGTTIELTTAQDDLVGTANDDSFVADILTFNSGDKLDGAAGNDTLTAEINTNIDLTTEVKNIETISLTALGTRTVDMKNFTGVEKVISNNSTGSITLNNVGDSIDLEFKGTGINNVTVNYKAEVLSGTNDSMNVTLNGATAVALDVDPGLETMSMDVAADSSLTTFTVPGVDNLTITGAGKLTLNNSLTGLKTVNASDMTGAIVGKDISPTTGLSTQGFTGDSAGTSVLLGSGDDNIKFTDNTSAGKSNTIKLGAGNDTLDITTAGAGASFVFAEEGDDTVKADGLTANDLIDMGAGADKLTLSGAAGNTAVLRGTEEVIVMANSSLDVNSADGALAVTALAATGSTAYDISVTNLTSGSTVVINDTKDEVAGAADVTVSYAAEEAQATIDVNSAVTSNGNGITIGKVTDLTLDFAKAVDLTNGTDDLTIDDTEVLTITAAKALDLGSGISNVAAGDKLTSISVTGSDAVDLDDILNSDKLATLTATATKTLTVGDVADAKTLNTVSLTGGTGVTLGRFGGTTASDDVSSVSVTATKGNISIADATDTSVINAKALGSVTMTANAGAILVTDDTDTLGNGVDFITAADSTGIEVNLSAKTDIKGIDSTADDFLLVTNTKGGITASLAGEAGAIINYVAATATDDAVVSLNASNTGGLTTTIVNDSTYGAAQTSTITLGNAATGKTNTVHLDGVADTINITGGTGTDVIDFVATNSYKNGTINLGTGGTDKIDFTNFAPTNLTAGTTAYDGLLINLSSSSVTLDAGTATATTVGANKVVQYDDDAISTKSNVDENGSTFTLSDVEHVVATANSDYIVANSIGTIIDGGDAADKIFLGAGDDKVVYTAASNSYVITDNASTSGTDETDLTHYDTISNLDVNNDVLQLIAKGTEVGIDGNNKINAAATDLSGAANLGAAFHSLKADGSTNATIKWGVYDADGDGTNDVLLVENLATNTNNLTNANIAVVILGVSDITGLEIDFQ